MQLETLWEKKKKKAGLETGIRIGAAELVLQKPLKFRAHIVSQCIYLIHFNLFTYSRIHELFELVSKFRQLAWKLIAIMPDIE